MINPMELTGKTILIAGATGEIGSAITKQVALLGANVIILARKREKAEHLLEELKEFNIKSYFLDFCKLDKIENTVEQIIDENGKLDGFVYAAGIVQIMPLKVMTPQRIEETMLINYSAFVEFVRCITRKKRCNDNASIVAISSTSSVKGNRARLSYSSSKAALDAAIRCMAHELSSSNKRIRVNSIQPAGVNTNMFLDYTEENSDSAHVAAMLNRQFLGLIEPYEIANVAAFLLSDATKCISGNSILLDAGILI